MPKKHAKPLLLVDGSSYLYRAYHAINLTNGAIFGVVKMLRKHIIDLQPDHVAVIFDAKGKTFRDKMYADYKANRPPMPDDLREQIEPLHAIVKAMGFPVLTIKGVEADDVIGTLAKQAEASNLAVLISTGDKDLAQLVNQHVTLVNTMTNVEMDPDGVVNKFGVRPDQIIDYLALIGDTSDNVPGIPSVGPKTAAKWLKQYDNLDEIVKNAEKIKGKVGEKFRDNVSQLELSKQLVTLKCDVELDKKPEDLKFRSADVEELKSWYSKLGFRSLLAELDDSANNESTDSTLQEKQKTKYDVIYDHKKLDVWISKLKKAKLFSFDTETTSINSMSAELVGVSFSVKEFEAAYVPLTHDYPGAPDQLKLDEVLSKLKPILESKTKKLIGQQIKYDKNILSRYDIDLQGIKHDTMMQSYVVDSTERHDMDTLALKYLGHSTIHFEDIAGKGVKQLTFNQIDLELAGPYAAEDADITLRLHQTLWQELEASSELRAVYEEIEIPLVSILARIEQTGVLIDRDMLAEQSKELAIKILDLEQQAYAVAGNPFNLGSPKQIQHILFEQQGLPVIKKTKKGQPSTAEEVLQELALDYPLPKLILEHRSLSKLKSTYVDKLPEQINSQTGRVHTSYHQAVAATGRLSSSNPNLQNIPVRSEEGRRIRKAFIPAKGFTMLAADYSQIELRIMAHLSEDKALLAAFAAGEDIHKATAAEVFSTPLDKVSKDQRRSAKAINFGLIYGMSAFGLARQLGIERHDAQNYVDMYFQQYPGVKEYMERIKELAHEQGYIETLYGRRLYLPEINAKNAMRRQYAERTAINAPMQGTAADIIKRAMIDLDGWIVSEANSEEVNIRMIMQVHDELVFEVKPKYLTEASNKVVELMSSAADLSVPLVVDLGQGDNWNEAH